MGVERQDWGSGGENRDIVPADTEPDSETILREMQAYPSNDDTETLATSLLEGFSDQQLERLDFVEDTFLERLSPGDFDEVLSGLKALPVDVGRWVLSVAAANPHATPRQLVKILDDQAMLEQATELRKAGW